MVGSSLRHEGEEVLGMRGGPSAYAERRSTFGIPLLHPWANRLGGWEYEIEGRRVTLDPESSPLKRDPDTGLPIHGLLNASRGWQVDQRERDRLEASLHFGAQAELLRAFPFPHVLEFRVTVTDKELRLELTLRPTGERAVPIAFGFHPYIALPGSRRGDWQIELPVRRRALLDDRGLPTGEHELLAPGALDGRLGDRVFDDSFDELEGDRAVAFSVSDGRRRVSVRYGSGYPVAQVYAPEDSPFIAFEPMTAPVDALRSGDRLRLVAPGESFSAEFAIAVGAV